MLDPTNSVMMFQVVESRDLKGDEQENLYAASFHTAVGKYGRR